jgi:hypothetical protein
VDRFAAERAAFFHGHRRLARLVAELRARERECVM